VADQFLRPLDAWCLGSPHVRHLASLSSFWDSRTPLPFLLLAHFSRFHPLLSRSRGLAMVAEQQRCCCSSTTAGPRVLLRPRPAAGGPPRLSMLPPPAASRGLPARATRHGTATAVPCGCCWGAAAVLLLPWPRGPWLPPAGRTGLLPFGFHGDDACLPFSVVCSVRMNRRKKKTRWEYDMWVPPDFI
jgi:hypothetical protein